MKRARYTWIKQRYFVGDDVNNALVLIGIGSAIAVGAMSPGPSFVMITRTAVASSRSNGFYAALGMGLGGMLFATAALLGLNTMLAAVPWLYFSMKILGGSYLFYLGFKIWRGAKDPLIVTNDKDAVLPASTTRSLLLGFGTQISNPKTAIVYASVFAALLPLDFPLPLALSLPFLIFFIEAGWYAVVAFALSATASQAAYLRHKFRIDRMAGGAMMLLGARLVAQARQLAH